MKKIFISLIIITVLFGTMSCTKLYKPTNPAPTETYTVTFKVDDSTYKEVAVQSGKSVTKPTSPINSSAIFAGWYTDSNGGSAFSFSSPIVCDTTLYAQFGYAVVLNSGAGIFADGDMVKTVFCKTGSGFELHTDEYALLGPAGASDEIHWYVMDADSDNNPNTDELPVTDITMGDKNITLFAEWEDSRYTITSDGFIEKGENVEGEIYLPTTVKGKQVKGLAKDAFLGCTELTSIVLPQTTVAIADGAFSGCTKLESISTKEGFVVPQTIRSIGKDAFYNCNAITSANLGTGVTSIGEGAFSGCAELNSVTISPNTSIIGKNAFKNTALVEVLIPDSVITIGEGSFSDSNNNSVLESVTIGSNVKTIGANAFNNTMLETVSVPNSVTTLGEGAFANCSNLVEITLGSGITDISDNTFSETTRLKKINIPTSVTSIGASAFKNSTLQSITIPNTVSVTDNAFAGATRLTIYAEQTTEPGWNSGRPTIYGCTLNKDSIVNPYVNKVSNEKIKDKGSSVFFAPTRNDLLFYGIVDNAKETQTSADYLRTSTPVETYDVLWNEGIAIKFYSGLGKFENSKKTKVHQAMTGEEITLPTSINNGESEDSSTITRPGNLADVDTKWYTSDGVELTGTTFIADKDTYIYAEWEDTAYSFEQNSDLTYTLKKGSTDASGDIFLPFTHKGRLVTAIGENAFKDCTGITGITISERINTIAGNAFAGCTEIKKYTVNASNTTYKSMNDNLYSKDGLTLVQYATGKTETSYTIPHGVKTLASQALSNTVLQKITVPSSVYYMGDRVFKDNPDLDLLYVNTYYPPAIGVDVFDGCDELDYIFVPRNSVNRYKNTTGWKLVGTGTNALNAEIYTNQVYNPTTNLKTQNISINEDHILKVTNNGPITTTIYYTTNGSKPSSTELTSDITVNITTTGDSKTYKFMGTHSVNYKPSGSMSEIPLSIRNSDVVTVKLTGKSINMISIPGGTFERRLDWDNSNCETQEITVDNFKMSQTEITQYDWERVMGDWPGNKPAWYNGTGSDHPAYNVSWFDAVRFCNTLSVLEGKEPVYYFNGSPIEKDTPDSVLWSKELVKADWTKTGYRLPTEAEWEYAAGGGENPTDGRTIYAGTNDKTKLGSYAWYYNNAWGKSRPVDCSWMNKNQLELSGMTGNVFEWCWDGLQTTGSVHAAYVIDYDTSSTYNPKGVLDSNRVVSRGGSVWSADSYSMVYVRNTSDVNDRVGELGFRIVLSDAAHKIAKPIIDVDNELVTITSASGNANAGVTIYYTTDDSTPTTSSSIYNANDKPKVTATCTIKALAIMDGHTDSSIGVFNHTAP